MGRALPYLLVAALALVVRAFLPAGGRRMRFARELLQVAPMILLYFVARGLADVRPERAAANAEKVIGLERALGLFHELSVQALVGRFPPLLDVANWIYIFGHWPVIVTIFVWLAWVHPDRVGRYRDAIVISGTIGIVIFLTFPSAPPRFMPGLGFVDTILLRSRAYRVLQPASLSDLYAAMPSLHVGWNLVMGIALVREARRRGARVFGALMPLAMFFAVVATANHYILDALVGAGLVTASLLVAERIAGRSARSASAGPLVRPHGAP